MSIPARYPPACRGPWAELCCHIGLDCSQAVCHAAARGHCLALSPGNITEDAALCQGAQTARIALPACKDYVVEKRSVLVPPSCQAADEPLSCICTTTTKRASARAVHDGDPVTYRITFTNHAPIPLDAVRICDDIQEGVIPGSIRPAPGPGETLRTGIAMGTLGPGQSAVLTYDAIAAFTDSCPMASRAWVRYRCTDQCGGVHRGTSGYRSCEVFRLPDRRPLRRCVCRRLLIRDFSRFRYFYVYHRGVDCFKSECGCTLVIKFGIAVKYIDCRGKRGSRYFEDSVQFTDPAQDFDPSNARIRFTGLTCDADDLGRITAKFSVLLQTG